jgi:poly-gamma-glutamate capsule biosynthesis protein CapA/YwtB (metallophosphatase superfamily)
VFGGIVLRLIACLLLLLPAAAAARPVVVTAVGDIMLAGRQGRFFARTGYDYPFAATAPLLRQGDITVANLEAPIARHGREFTGKRFRFMAAPAVAPALKRAGLSLLTLANNHILDYGPGALAETITHLDRQGLAHAGAGADLAAARQPAIIIANGHRVAFLAYSLTQPTEFFATAGRPGTAPGHAAFYRADIARARRQANHVVVSFHWGAEGAGLPKAYQVTAARQAIDAGASVVIGHHPHVLQGIERYRDGVILYSLGNFAFASDSRTADRSIIARITLDGGVREVEVIPLNVLNREVRYQPRPLAGQGADEVVARLNRLSRGMGTGIGTVAGRYLVGEQGNMLARR